MMKFILLFVSVISVFASYAFSQTPSQTTYRSCTQAETEQLTKTKVALKTEIQNKVEKSEDVRCIGYYKDESRLSCGIHHGALATLIVKIKYSIGTACDATTMKVKNYKISYTYKYAE